MEIFKTLANYDYADTDETAKTIATKIRKFAKENEFVFKTFAQKVLTGSCKHDLVYEFQGSCIADRIDWIDSSTTDDIVPDRAFETGLDEKIIQDCFDKSVIYADFSNKFFSMEKFDTLVEKAVSDRKSMIQGIFDFLKTEEITQDLYFFELGSTGLGFQPEFGNKYSHKNLSSPSLENGWDYGIEEYYTPLLEAKEGIKLTEREKIHLFDFLDGLFSEFLAKNPEKAVEAYETYLELTGAERE